YRARKLKSGEWQLEIRSTEYLGKGSETIRLPVGTSKATIHTRARNSLQKLANSNVPELAKKVLKDITLNNLIDAFLTFKKDLSKRDLINVEAFKKYNPSLLDKTLDQSHLIKKGIEDFINRRIEKGIMSDTVIRQLSPIRSMYRDAGKTRLYGLAEDTVA